MPEPDWRNESRAACEWIAHLSGTLHANDIIPDFTAAMRKAYAAGKRDASQWLPIADAPKGKLVLLVSHYTKWQSINFASAVDTATHWQDLPAPPEDVKP